MAQAGSITVTTSKVGTSVVKYSVAWVSSAGGAVDENTFNVVAGELLQVGFVPDSGGTQPSDLYDVTFKDANGVEFLGTLGANLSQTTASVVVPVVGTYFRRTFEKGALTPVVANGGAAKGGTIVLLIRPF